MLEATLAEYAAGRAATTDPRAADAAPVAEEIEARAQALAATLADERLARRDDQRVVGGRRRQRAGPAAADGVAVDRARRRIAPTRPSAGCARSIRRSSRASNTIASSSICAPCSPDQDSTLAALLCRTRHERRTVVAAFRRRRSRRQFRESRVTGLAAVNANTFWSIAIVPARLWHLGCVCRSGALAGRVSRPDSWRGDDRGDRAVPEDAGEGALAAVPGEDPAGDCRGRRGYSAATMLDRGYGFGVAGAGRNHPDRPVHRHRCPRPAAHQHGCSWSRSPWCLFAVSLDPFDGDRHGGVRAAGDCVEPLLGRVVGGVTPARVRARARAASRCAHRCADRAGQPARDAGARPRRAQARRSDPAHRCR